MRAHAPDNDPLAPTGSGKALHNLPEIFGREDFREAVKKSLKETEAVQDEPSLSLFTRLFLCFREPVLTFASLPV